MGIAIGVCAQTSWWGEHPSPTSRGVLFTQTAKTAQTSRPLLVSSGLGADTIDSHLRAMTVRTTDVRGWFSRKVNCHA